MRLFLQNLKMFDVSTIILSYNTKDLTESAIKSVISDKSEIKNEIIAVDNGSTDGSVTMLEKYKKTGLIKLILNKVNNGFAKANNQGISQALGRHILLLNSDTKVKEKAIEYLVNFADKTQEAGVVGARLLNSNGSLQQSCTTFPSLSNEFKRYFLNQSKKFDEYTPKGSHPTKVESLSGAAFLITKKALEKIGKFDEKYFFYYEDIDYCKRVHDGGLGVYYLPKAVIVHYAGSSIKNVDDANRWRRFIPSSKIYNGTIKHYLIFLVMWLGQKWQKYFQKQH
jgi:GT2 family glycosyltransferase